MTMMRLDELSDLGACLTEEERQIQSSVRRFVAERYSPHAAEYFEREHFPRELVAELGELGVLGANIPGHGCAGMGAVAYGLVLQELEYGDSALRSFVSVQGSLAMHAIWAFGSEEQRQQYLPAMATGELIGCFGLTEPDSGSDPSSMRTHAKRDGDDYVLSGTKMWITNAPLSDLAVVWAKVEQAGGERVAGFLIERGTAGFSTPTTHGKLSLRASATGQLVLDDCRIPARNRLPDAVGLRSALQCLDQARFGIAWGAIGAAKACFVCVQDYTATRTQFGVPVAHKQLVQAELVEMASEIVRADLMNLHYGRLKDAASGKLLPEQVSLCKRANVRAALDVARRCRALLGANGILLDYPVLRHALNLESVYTYEGTHEIHTLILGRALTGVGAF
jgi:glutaryl-CoA dehydrogenase